MSELKCPCCGNDLKETYLGYVCSNTSLKDPCSFRITKEQLPRISAAMELAQLEVEFENCKAEDEHKYQEMIEWARNDVLRAFK